MEQIYKYMVCVRCITYNQASYIIDAMNGFTMQRTKFPIVYVVVDDASTDEEPNTISKYLLEQFDIDNPTIARHEETDDYRLIFAQHKTNKNCFFAVHLLKYNHYRIKKPKELYFDEWSNNSKYIAINEGDDFWVDPLKLQKQVDFMESHPQHSLCFCAHRNLFSSGETKDVHRYDGDKEECPMEDIILGGGGYMATNSMFYRNSMYIPYTTWAIGCPIGDLPLMLTLAHKGYVGYLADVMCVYRRTAIGSWSQRMSSDISRRRQHYKAIIKMWRQFDEWSGRKNHWIIAKKIRRNQKDHLKDVLSTLKNEIIKK